MKLSTILGNKPQEIEQQDNDDLLKKFFSLASKSDMKMTYSDDTGSVTFKKIGNFQWFKWEPKEV